MRPVGKTDEFYDRLEAVLHEATTQKSLSAFPPPPVLTHYMFVFCPDAGHPQQDVWSIRLTPKQAGGSISRSGSIPAEQADVVVKTSKAGFFSLIGGKKAAIMKLVATGALELQGERRKLRHIRPYLAKVAARTPELHSRLAASTTSSESNCSACAKHLRGSWLSTTRQRQCLICSRFYCSKCCLKFDGLLVCQRCLVDTRKKIQQRADVEKVATGAPSSASGKDNSSARDFHAASPSLLQSALELELFQQEQLSVACSNTSETLAQQDSQELSNRIRRLEERLQTSVHSSNSSSNAQPVGAGRATLGAFIALCLFRALERLPPELLALPRRAAAFAPHFVAALPLSRASLVSAPAAAAQLAVRLWPKMGEAVAQLASLALRQSAFFALLVLVLLLLLTAATVRALPTEHSPLKRRLRIYWLGARVIGSYAAVRSWHRLLRSPQARVNAAFERLHEAWAPTVFEELRELAGFWVKVGQYLGSRADVVPAAWVKALQGLQDAAKSDAFAEVREIIAGEIGQAVGDVFADIEALPLASASIAQVHKATLQNGQCVVIKVQHPSIARTMPTDLHNLGVLMSWVRWLNRDFDFKPVLDEWSTETLKELDFRHEAENMKEVRANFERTGLLGRVVIPQVVNGLVAQRVLVMEFIEGFRVTDGQMLDRFGVDRMALVKLITQAYAQQIYLDGFFNGDPHPGNILVQVTRDPSDKSGGKFVAKPVLLDFGLTKRLTPTFREALGNLVASAAASDSGGLLEAFEQVGVRLKRESPQEDMETIRFVLRDTAPPSEMRSATRRFRQRARRRREAAPKALRNPVDAWPQELLFFFRVTMLLRALCSRLGVRLPYLSVLAPYARLSLCKQVPIALHCTKLLHPAREGVPAGSLQERVRRVVAQLHGEGQLVGVQAVCMQRGRVLVNVVAGTMGSTDPRPVLPSSLFNCFSVTKAVCALALHILLDAKRICLGDTVAAHWPAFAQRGKERVTVRQLLCHRAGLARATPASTSVEKLREWRAMLRAVEEAEPAHPPGEKQQYHYMSFGYLCAGLVEAVAGMSFERFVAQHITAKLHSRALQLRLFADADSVTTDRASAGAATARVDLRKELLLGLGPKSLACAGQGEGGEAEYGAVAGRVARLCNGFGPNGEAPSPEQLRRIAQQMQAWRDGGEGKSEDKGEEEEEEESVFNGGISLVDPCVFNTKTVRRCLLPSANGHFSARALACLFDALAADFLKGTGKGGGAEGHALMSSEGASRLVHAFPPQRPDRWNLGFQAVGLEVGEGEGKRLPRAFGHGGLGGSIAFCVPEEGLSIAVCVNKLTLDAAATASIVNTIVEGVLGLRVSEDSFAGGGGAFSAIFGGTSD